MLLGHLKSSVSSFNLTHPRWSYTTLNTHNESCATLVRRSWSSECSIGEVGIVFTWLLMLVYELMEGQTGLGPATTCLEGKGSTNWTTTPYKLISLSTLYKYYTTIFEKNQIFTHSNSQVGVVIWSCGAKGTLQKNAPALNFYYPFWSPTRQKGNCILE